MTHSVEMDSNNAFGSAAYYHDADGRRFSASALIASDRGQQRLVAVLAVQVSGTRTPVPPSGLRAQIAMQLLEHADTPGVPFGGS